MDEITLRDVLVTDREFELEDFGPSIQLSIDADVDTICEEYLTAKVEILHLAGSFIR